MASKTLQTPAPYIIYAVLYKHSYGLEVSSMPHVTVDTYAPIWLIGYQ